MGFKEAKIARNVVEDGAEITKKIDRYVELRQFVNEQKALGNEIKEFLKDNGVAELKSPSGNIARLKPGTPGKRFFTWAVDRLQKFLKPKAFKLACPPTPDEVLLNQMAEEDKALLKCGEWDVTEPGKPTLEIQAAVL